MKAVPGTTHGTPRQGSCHQDTGEGLRERAGCANNDILHVNISMPRDAPSDVVTHHALPVETEAQSNEHLAEGRVSSPGHELRLSWAMITTAAVELHRDKFQVILCHSASTGASYFHLHFLKSDTQTLLSNSQACRGASKKRFG